MCNTEMVKDDVCGLIIMISKANVHNLHANDIYK